MQDKKSKDAELDFSQPMSQALKGMTLDDWRNEALEDYLQCCLCGTNLKFKHQIDFATLNVDEEAFCMHCQIRAHKREYRLQ